MRKLSGNSAPSATAGEVVREAREAFELSVRELARRAGISHTQVSRLESGVVARPSRDVLVSLARALDRNPTPLLILAGYLDRQATRDALAPLFRSGAELADVWKDADWVATPLDQVRAVLADPAPAPEALDRIAADVFMVAESDETLWDDSYTLAAARGDDADQLREFMTIWRFVDRDLRTRWLEYGRHLRRLTELEAETRSRTDIDDVLRNTGADR